MREFKWKPGTYNFEVSGLPVADKRNEALAMCKLRRHVGRSSRSSAIFSNRRHCPQNRMSFAKFGEARGVWRVKHWQTTESYPVHARYRPNCHYILSIVHVVVVVSERIVWYERSYQERLIFESTTSEGSSYLYSYPHSIAQQIKENTEPHSVTRLLLPD